MSLLGPLRERTTQITKITTKAAPEKAKRQQRLHGLFNCDALLHRFNRRIALMPFGVFLCNLQGGRFFNPQTQGHKRIFID